MFEWVGAVAVLDNEYRRFAVIAIAVQTAKRPARRRGVSCGGERSGFAVNDGLRLANPSYEVIRLTAFNLP